ncbi:MAG: PLDc_N domain-containing protein [Bacteroidetes bacterium]|nr:PLDc_N domain-containing protein [Fibrella sp.]
MLCFIGLSSYEVLLLAGGVLLATVLFPLIALIDILRSEFAEPNNKLIWVLVVLFLNVIGAILYYAIGRKQRIA